MKSEKILEQAKAQFNQRRELLGPIEVPEWSHDPEKPLKLFVQPMNIGEKSAMLKAVQEGTYLDGAVMGLILQARDADGRRIFKRADFDALVTDADPAVIERINSEMAALLQPSQEAEHQVKK